MMFMFICYFCCREPIVTMENPRYRDEKTTTNAVRGYRFSRDASVYISPKVNCENRGLEFMIIFQNLQ